MQKFSLRALFAVTTIVAVAICIGIIAWRGLADAHPAAVRNAYMEGKITRQQARDEIGDAVDAWPDSIHERANEVRAAKQNNTQP